MCPYPAISLNLQRYLSIRVPHTSSWSCVSLIEPCLNSVQVQLADLIDCLDKGYWESDLYAALEEIRDEVHTHMDITEDLTNKARGTNKCFFTAANGKENSILPLWHMKSFPVNLRHTISPSFIMDLSGSRMSFGPKYVFLSFSCCVCSPLTPLPASSSRQLMNATQS